MKQTVHSRAAKWMISAIAFLLLCFSGKAISLQQKAQTNDGPDVADVGMVALLASPRQYDGKLIRTSGFLCIEFEGDALYFHEEDYRYGLTKNSFKLRLSKLQREQFKGLNSHYVIIEGTLYANGPERTDIWSGALGRISRLEIWPVDRRPTPQK